MGPVLYQEKMQAEERRTKNFESHRKIVQLLIKYTVDEAAAVAAINGGESCKTKPNNVIDEDDDDGNDDGDRLHYDFILPLLKLFWLSLVYGGNLTGENYARV